MNDNRSGSPEGHNHARVRALLPNGDWLEVASMAIFENGPSPSGRLKLKGEPQFNEFARHAVSLARLAEPPSLHQHRVVLTLASPRTLGPDHSLFKLAGELMQTAAVIADKACRGLATEPKGGFVVWACCDDWFVERLRPVDRVWQLAGVQALAHPDAQLAEALVVMALDTEAQLPGIDAALAALRPAHPGADIRLATHLQGIAGSLSQRRLSRTASAWFPTVAGDGSVALERLSVAVAPLATAAPPDAEPPVNVVRRAAHLEPHLATQVRQVLAAVRHLDRHSDQWQTVVELPARMFASDSYQLALAMADRIARGREWPGPGRLLATGSVDTREGHEGAIGDVLDALPIEGGSNKWAALKAQVRPGDTVLLPKAWRAKAPSGLYWVLPDVDEWLQPAVHFVGHVWPGASPS